jgi:UDP-N-acetylmuramate: L-alanyl-gamma-D-glutamyl-meso-diaminopimelate ligase
LFNARNAAMAGLSAALASGLASPVEFDLSALSRFKGVQRRQDVLYSSEQCIVLEDFGHHPTAIAATLGGIRAAYPERKLIAVFEPRSNTACTSIFQEAFTEALSLADSIFMGAVHRAERIAADRRLNTKKIAGVFSERGCTAVAFDSNEALMDEIRVQAPLMDGVVMVFFTNGSFDGVQHKTAALLRS